MDKTTFEAVMDNTAEYSEAEDVRELGDLQLALVGGGIADVIAG